MPVPQPQESSSESSASSGHSPILPPRYSCCDFADWCELLVVVCMWSFVLHCCGHFVFVKLVMFLKNLNGLFFAQLVHSGPGLCDNGKWFLCMDALSDVHPPVSKHWRQLNILTVLLLLYPFNGLFSRTTWVSWYQKGKTSLDLNGV